MSLYRRIRRRLPPRVAGVCGVLLGLFPDVVGAAAPIPRLTVPAHAANATFTTAPLPAAGLALTLEGANAAGTPTTLRLTLRAARSSADVAPRGALGADFPERIAWRAGGARSAATAHAVVLKRRARGWRVYLDGQIAALFPDRFAGPVTILHDAHLRPAARVAGAGAGTEATGEDAAEEDEEDDEAHVQRVAAFRFTDDFLIDEADAEGRKLRHWDQVSGTWSVHSVQDGMEEHPAGPPRGNVPPPPRRRRRAPSAAHSPNFYSVEGYGTNAVMLTGHAFYDRYIMTAAVHAGDGENGIVFLATPEYGLHGFTATPRPDGEGLRFVLWQSDRIGVGDRRTLAAYDTDLLPGQWHRLAARVEDERVTVSVNGVRLAAVDAALPPGGQFGLFAHGAGATRFDDVAAASHEDLEFASVAAFRAALLHAEGRIERRRGELPVALAADEGATTPPEHLALAPAGERPGIAVFGTVRDAPRVLATTVQGEGRPFEAALLAGWQGPDAAALRFAVRQTPTNRVFRLEWTIGGAVATGTVAQLTLPLPPSNAPLALMLDATGAEGLRAYADGRLVLVAPDLRGPGGASGVAVLSRAPLALALPIGRGFRDEFRNRVEKTATFAADAFMRYWASPEGEWIQHPDGATWFRGDLFGAVAVRLPWKQPVRLSLAVAEGAAWGPLEVVAEEDRLRLREHAAAEDAAPRLLAEADAAQLAWEPLNAEGTQSNRWYTVHLEDHALWVRSGERTLFVHALVTPPAGRRLRVEGLSVEDLGRSRVERTNIADFLFTESLHEWDVNGGRWEVVNRFQCDPRWSHLNGQNAESLAALWSRYEFAGDFGVELYAGMRQGWYDRPGDLNLTVLNRVDAPSSGYTFVCTGWDPDESQRFSRLFREGTLLAQTDAYLVPRVREGSVRRGYNPLLAGGRDVHGAWYYVQLRRVDGALQVFFDHEPVLTVRDPAPLPVGGLGIWTYRNSMVVARVRMAAERIRPRRFAARAIPADGAATPTADTPWSAACMPFVAQVAQAAGLDPAALPPSAAHPRYPARPAAWRPPMTAEGLPLAFWTPDVWSVDDSVSNPRFAWRPDADAPDTFVVTARQAGGSFFATNALAAVPLRHLAGWRFETARTPDAQYNFHYTVGRMQDGAFVPAQGFFHVLAGSADTRTQLLRGGATPVPAAAGADPLAGPWTEVSVWLPAFPREEETLWVRVDGFGNLNPSDVQQGLLGNRPGAAYAVRRFAPILMGAPTLAEGTLAEAPRKAWEAAVAGRRTSEVHSLALPAAVPATVHWVLPPANLELTAAWHPDWHDVVEIRSAIPWPVRHLKGLPATVNGVEATVAPREGNTLLVQIPRQLAAARPALFQLDLATAARRPVGWGLPALDRPPTVAPVLLAIESELFRLETFEQARPGSAGGLGTVRALDPRQGHHLRSANGGTGRRLITPLTGAIDLARNPVLQFRHRAEGLAQVSVRLDRLGDVAFAEPQAAARAVRGHNPGVGEEWRTWSGMLADHLPERAFDAGLFTVDSVTLQSVAGTDQTGRFATLSVDDIVAGPAVGPRRPLRIVPRLFDLDGDGFVEWALLPGVAPYDASAGAAAALTWQRVEDGATVEVPLHALAPGVHHVLFRPASPRGRGSVTGVPFLHCPRPPTVTGTVVAAPHRDNGTRLLMVFDLGGGGLPDLRTLRLTCDGAEVADVGQGTTLAVGADQAVLGLDWPRLLQRQIQKSRDGDTLALRVEGLADGAGNALEATTIAIPIRYADDRTPPWLQQVEAPESVAWWLAWHAPFQAASFRTINQAGHRVVPATDAQPATLQIDIGGHQAFASARFQSAPWNPARFPLLALRVGFARLPAQTSPQTLQLTLLHGADANQALTASLPLFADARALPAEVSGTTDWSAGGVSELVVDVGAWLKRVAEGQPVGQITGLRFEFGDAPNAQFQIHDVIVFAPWTPQAALQLRAYDASGVAGLAWQHDGGTEALALAPAAVDGLPAKDAWLRLRVRDRAGNATHALHVPVVRAPAATAPGAVP